MFSIPLLQKPKSTDVAVIINSIAATAFIAGANAKAMVTVAVVITCVTAASVFVFTHIMAVTRDKNVAVPFIPLKRLFFGIEKEKHGTQSSF